MNKSIKILHLEDSLNDSMLIHSIIEEGKIIHDYTLTDNEKDFKNILKNENIDLILSDYSLPTYNGNEALIFAKEKYSRLPFIFVSGTMGEDAAITSMLNGAADYVFKNKLSRLVPAIKRVMHELKLEINHDQAAKALLESERKYKNLINELNDGYFVTNSEGRISFANNYLAKILGYANSDELAGHYFSEFSKSLSSHNNIVQIFRNIIENHHKMGEIEMEVLPVVGNSIFVEIKLVPYTISEKVAGIQGVIHDITERKQTDIKLRNSNEQILAQNMEYIQINKELAFQYKEKNARAAELIAANILKETEEKYRILIEDKNKNITDSIKYAQRIQMAMLPKKEDIYSSLKQCFVLFKPKDIVSGDFYFFHKTADTIFIIAADCTGHGVPGALMSMMGSEKLSKALAQSSDPSEILKQLNNGIKSSLRQSDIYESAQDGMDIAICCIDIKKRILGYAGALIPLWIIRAGMSEIEETRGTRVSIGGMTEMNQQFECHKFKLKEGDTFYISTDGYSDQFHGQDCKKLTSGRFKKILLEIQDKSMKDQEKHLDNFIENWKGGTDQLDDILVIGVRL
jgi:PAS domain S-box-containing protein